MKRLLTATLATATLALTACGAEPEVDEAEVDPTFEGAGDLTSDAGAGADTGAMEAAQNGGDGAMSDDTMMSDDAADTMDGDMEPGYEMETE